jgi:cytochrome c-type biogenesis protein CcmH
MIEQGKEDEQIIDFMVTRYGEFVLYRPRVSEVTWLLWYGPFVLLGIGLLAVVMISRNRRQRQASGSGEGGNNAEFSSHSEAYTPEPGLDAEEAERLKKLLQRDSDK